MSACDKVFQEALGIKDELFGWLTQNKKQISKNKREFISNSFNKLLDIVNTVHKELSNQTQLPSNSVHLNPPLQESMEQLEETVNKPLSPPLVIVDPKLVGKNFMEEDGDKRRTVIVTSDADLDSKDLRNLLLERVDCKKLDIKVVDVFLRKNSKVILKLVNETQADKLLDHLQKRYSESKISACNPNLSSTRVFITNVHKSITKLDLIEFFAEYFGLDTDEFSASCVNKVERNFNSWILYVPRVIAKFMIQQKTFHFNFCPIYVHSYFKIIRCFKCQEYGHSDRNCNNLLVCSKCSKNHSSDKCNSDNFTCINCKYLNIDEDLCHHATNDYSCITYRSLVKNAKVGVRPFFVRNNSPKNAISPISDCETSRISNMTRSNSSSHIQTIATTTNYTTGAFLSEPVNTIAGGSATRFRFNTLLSSSSVDEFSNSRSGTTISSSFAPSSTTVFDEHEKGQGHGAKYSGKKTRQLTFCISIFTLLLSFFFIDELSFFCSY